MKTSATWATFLLGVGLWSLSCSSDKSPGGSAGGGGTGPGGADGSGGSETFELTGRFPDRDEANAWSAAPIELEFSEPIDETTLDGALELQVLGAPLAFSSSLDGTGRRLELILQEVPPLPARVSISIGSSLRSVEGKAFSGESWAWDLPFWQAPASPPAPLAGVESGLAMTVAEGREVLVAYGTSAGLTIAELAGRQWTSLPEVTPVDDSAALQVVALLGTSRNEATVAWLETTDQQALHVARFDGSAWEVLGGGPAGTGAELMPQVRRDASGAVVAGVRSSGTEVTVLRAGQDAWSTVGEPLEVGATTEWTLALDDEGRPLIAYVNAQGDIAVSHWTDEWTELATLDRQQEAGSVEVQLLWVEDAPVLAYVDGDERSQHVQVARYDGQWRPLGAALDVEIEAEVSEPRLHLDAGGRLFASWRERYATDDRVFVARQVGDGWQVLGPSPGRGHGATYFALSADGDGNAHVAWLAESGGDVELRLRRFNASPRLPFGLERLGGRGACVIPEDADPNFPETLTATGCYENVATQQMVGAAIPYTINSILWSDDAAKKRYVLLPEGSNASVDYVSVGALGFPVGTILIKEFYLERTVGQPATLFPVETRFLIKRCEEGACLPSWQGYSYQWNEAGTEGTLLEDAHAGEWNVTDDGVNRTHTHLYPSRTQCLDCHNEAAGRVLGLQSKQLNKAHDYGHTVDNQLRAWIAAGLFGSSAPSEPPEELPRLPQPPDVGHSLEERTRSYFHANCSHCHREGNVAGTNLRFRYEDPLAGNICNFVTPGDHEASNIWIRDSIRGASQMPPIATGIVDSRQLAVTAAWIDSLGDSCP